MHKDLCAKSGSVARAKSFLNPLVSLAKFTLFSDLVDPMSLRRTTHIRSHEFPDHHIQENKPATGMMHNNQNVEHMLGAHEFHDQGQYSNAKVHWRPALTFRLAIVCSCRLRWGDQPTWSCLGLQLVGTTYHISLQFKEKKMKKLHYITLCHLHSIGIPCIRTYSLI